MRLMQLKNGSWIDPRTVIEVRVRPRRTELSIGTASMKAVSPGVVVRTHGDQYSVVDVFATDEEARDYADEIARIVNGIPTQDIQ